MRQRDSLDSLDRLDSLNLCETDSSDEDFHDALGEEPQLSSHTDTGPADLAAPHDHETPVDPFYHVLSALVPLISGSIFSGWKDGFDRLLQLNQPGSIIKAKLLALRDVPVDNTAKYTLLQSFFAQPMFVNQQDVSPLDDHLVQSFTGPQLPSTSTAPDARNRFLNEWIASLEQPAAFNALNQIQRLKIILLDQAHLMRNEAVVRSAWNTLLGIEYLIQCPRRFYERYIKAARQTFQALNGLIDDLGLANGLDSLLNEGMIRVMGDRLQDYEALAKIADNLQTLRASDPTGLTYRMRQMQLCLVMCFDREPEALTVMNSLLETKPDSNRQFSNDVSPIMVNFMGEVLYTLECLINLYNGVQCLELTSDTQGESEPEPEATSVMGRFYNQIVDGVVDGVIGSVDITWNARAAFRQVYPSWTAFATSLDSLSTAWELLLQSLPIDAIGQLVNENDQLVEAVVSESMGCSRIEHYMRSNPVNAQMFDQVLRELFYLMPNTLPALLKELQLFREVLNLTPMKKFKSIMSPTTLQSNVRVVLERIMKTVDANRAHFQAQNLSDLIVYRQLWSRLLQGIDASSLTNQMFRAKNALHQNARETTEDYLNSTQLDEAMCEQINQLDPWICLEFWYLVQMKRMELNSLYQGPEYPDMPSLVALDSTQPNLDTFRPTNAIDAVAQDLTQDQASCLRTEMGWDLHVSHQDIARRVFNRLTLGQFNERLMEGSIGYIKTHALRYFKDSLEEHDPIGQQWIQAINDLVLIQDQAQYDASKLMFHYQSKCPKGLTQILSQLYSEPYIEHRVESGKNDIDELGTHDQRSPRDLTLVHKNKELEGSLHIVSRHIKDHESNGIRIGMMAMIGGVICWGGGIYIDGLDLTHLMPWHMMPITSLVILSFFAGMRVLKTHKPCFRLLSLVPILLVVSFSIGLHLNATMWMSWGCSHHCVSLILVSISLLSGLLGSSMTVETEQYKEYQKVLRSNPIHSTEQYKVYQKGLRSNSILEDLRSKEYCQSFTAAHESHSSSSKSDSLVA